jgi:hypothetical protein
MTNILFDILMIGLLVVAIIFCYRLNVRLNTMKEMGTELSPFMKYMSDYLGQISQSIDKLKQVADVSKQGLNENIPLAINLKDDFDLLLEHSEKMLKRLDEVIDKARAVDQRLQQTMRIVESSRSKDQFVESVGQKFAEQKPAEPPRQSSVQEEPFEKNNRVNQEPYMRDMRFKDTSIDDSLQFSAPSFGRDETDYFIPNQQQQSQQRRTESPFNADREYGVNPKHPPAERGIMAKLKGLR